MRVRNVSEAIQLEILPELDRRNPIDRRDTERYRRWKADIGSGTKYRIHKRRTRQQRTSDRLAKTFVGIHNRRSKKDPG